ncbi:MAG: hypothetical protein M3457_21875 [Chloroflexota bacterium]|nr:hypothetical protein [Chloroflexota bacterium]
MRKLLLTLFATLLLMGSSAALVATAQDDATPEAGAGEASGPGEGTNPIDPAIGDTVTYYGEDGNSSGTATVTEITRGWEEFDEFNEPERGSEYVAFTVVVESTISRGAIEVDDYDFSLQTAEGYLWPTSFASSETAEPPLLEDAVSLASGDSEEFTIVFEVFEGEALAHLFWQPDSGVLITMAQLEGE